jgi:hypothetical protein
MFPKAEGTEASSATAQRFGASDILLVTNEGIEWNNFNQAEFAIRFNGDPGPGEQQLSSIVKHRHSELDLALEANW